MGLQRPHDSADWSLHLLEGACKPDCCTHLLQPYSETEVEELQVAAGYFTVLFLGISR